MALVIFLMCDTLRLGGKIDTIFREGWLMAAASGFRAFNRSSVIKLLAGLS